MTIGIFKTWRISLAAIEQIIKWARGLPDWQGDAVRRFLEQGLLTDQDRDEIYQMIKESAGLEKECVTPVAPKVGDFSGTGVSQQPIALHRISDIEHVNAVENGSTIPFGHKGITVIYGENGSGKSSYGRVLKRACRARDTKEAIHPNVFDETEVGPATATIKIAEGEKKDIELPWEDGQPTDNRLASITFFDSKCARVIVDDNNEASYIPYGCETFDVLVSLVKSMRSRLESDKPIPNEPKSVEVVENTKPDVFLKNLNRNTKANDIDDATKWTDADEKKLTETTTRIAQSGTEDSLQEARRLQTIATRTGNLAEAIDTALKGISKDVVQQINDQLDAIVAAENAVELAAQDSLQDEILPTGTSNEWKVLYDAAKEFSTKIAYPNSDFPAVGSDELCVWCQQDLDTMPRVDCNGSRNSWGINQSRT